MSWTYATLNVGAKDSVKKVVTAEDVESFARISLDNNPVHLDEEFAKTTPFKRRIAHGMFSAGADFGCAGHQAARLRDHLHVSEPVVQAPGLFWATS